jgi:hypothetical protein
MTFIELLFRISPDNNTGMVELEIIFALCATLLAVWYLSCARGN